MFLQTRGEIGKRHTSKSSRYNTMMRYASYCLHTRLRFSRCMHEHSTARFQSGSRVKMRIVFLFVSVENSMTSFERSRKEEKKQHETGSNRFCTQTRLVKVAIIVSINPNHHCHHVLPACSFRVRVRVRIRIHY